MSVFKLQDINLNFNDCQVLRNISYTINKGDFVILLGSNGSGKSSLLKLLSRQYIESSGKISFANRNFSDFSARELAQHVRILTQNCSDSLFPSLTVYENYIMVKKSKMIHCISEKKFLQKYLQDYSPNLSKKCDFMVHQLSGGEKQALALALCLLNPPSLLLLDEHTSALDPKTSEQIMLLTQEKTNEYQITCVLTTHNLDIAMKYGNRILALKDGQILKMVEEEKKQFSKTELVNAIYDCHSR